MPETHLLSKSSIVVNTPSKKYSIYFKLGKIKSELKKLKQIHPQSKFAIISETNIQKHQQDLINSLIDKRTFAYFFPAGEKSKSISVKTKIEDFLFTHRFNRHDIIIALGGGVVGDLVGYVAATYMRGVTFYGVPTSLLSMVDSSVGGKTGINNRHGKNLVGAFYQPDAVFIDINLLKTLPDDHYTNGLAEIIKHGFIYQPNIYKIFSQELTAIIDRTNPKNHAVISDLIYKSITVKKDIVVKDEKENGLRRILNFGHTIGHAIEFLSHYRLKHGFAISIGMTVETYIAYRENHTPETTFHRVKSLLTDLGLPTAIPKKFSTEDIYHIMTQDKKNTTSTSLTMIAKIGEIHSNQKTFIYPMTKKKLTTLINDYRKLKN